MATRPNFRADENGDPKVGTKSPRADSGSKPGPNWTREPPKEEKPKEPTTSRSNGLSMQTNLALRENGLFKKGGSVMATKGKFPAALFAGKESKKEEKAEKKVGKKAYAAGEKSEGERGFKCGGKVKVKAKGR